MHDEGRYTDRWSDRRGIGTGTDPKKAKMRGIRTEEKSGRFCGDRPVVSEDRRALQKLAIDLRRHEHLVNENVSIKYGKKRE